MEKKPKVLLINPPGDKLYIRDIYHSFSSKGNYLWQPTDLVFLSGRLTHDFELEVVDAIAEGGTIESCLDQLRGKQYHAIISMTGSVSFESDFAFFSQLVKVTDSPLYLIGDMVWSQHKQLFEKFPFVQGVIFDFTSSDILPFLKGDLESPTGM